MFPHFFSADGVLTVVHVYFIDLQKSVNCKTGSVWFFNDFLEFQNFFMLQYTLLYNACKGSPYFCTAIEVCCKFRYEKGHKVLSPLKYFIKVPGGQAFFKYNKTYSIDNNKHKATPVPLGKEFFHSCDNITHLLPEPQTSHLSKKSISPQWRK